MSKQILADLQQDDNVQEDTTTKNLVNDVLIVTLNESESNSAENTIIKLHLKHKKKMYKQKQQL